MSSLLEQINKRLRSMEEGRKGKEEVRSTGGHLQDSHNSSSVMVGASTYLSNKIITKQEFSRSRCNNHLYCNLGKLVPFKSSNDDFISDVDCSRRENAPDADYMNYSEIVSRLKQLSHETLQNVAGPSSSCDHFDDPTKHYLNTCQRFNSDHDDQRNNIFDDIPREILDMVDEMVDDDKDVTEYFHVIDQVAFKPRFFQSNFHDKDTESDTDSGNGTLQTENGSCSSQTLHDILPDATKPPGDAFLPCSYQNVFCNDNRTISIPEQVNSFLPPPEFLGDLNDLPQYYGANTDVTNFVVDYSTPIYESPDEETMVDLLPPPEFAATDEKSDGYGENKRLYTRVIKANKGALKKVHTKSPAILDKIPGTFLSQSCIDLSQISPKRRVTFADEVVIASSSQRATSLSDYEENYEVENKTKRNKSRHDKPVVDCSTKSKSLSVFKFWSKKQHNGKEKEINNKTSKSKKTSKNSPKKKQRSNSLGDPFSPEDFEDSSFDEGSEDEMENKNKKINVDGKHGGGFLMAFDNSRGSKCVDNNSALNTPATKNGRTVSKDAHKTTSEMKYRKRGSWGGIFEDRQKCPPVRQGRNSIPATSLSLDMKDVTHKTYNNPLKNLKLKFRQLRGKDDEEKISQSTSKNKSRFVDLPEDVVVASEDIQRDMDEALMNQSDEEYESSRIQLAISSTGKKEKSKSEQGSSKHGTVSYYKPVHFYKKRKQKINPNINRCSMTSQPFESFNTNNSDLAKNNADSENNHNFQTDQSNPVRKKIKFVLGAPSRFQASTEIPDSNVLSLAFKKPLPVVVQPVAVELPENITTAEICFFPWASNKEESELIEEQNNSTPRNFQNSDTSIQKCDESDELYLNHSEWCSLESGLKTSEADPIDAANAVDQSSNSVCTPSATFQTNKKMNAIHRSKPLVMKVKPYSSNIDPVTVKDTKKPSGLDARSNDIIYTDSLECILQLYDSTNDSHFLKAISHCDKLSKDLRSLLDVSQALSNLAVHSDSKFASEKPTKISLENLKSLCLDLVSSGKSLLIASTASQTSLNDKVTKSIHCLAKFSREAKNFAKITNSKGLKDLLSQFACVVDLFELIIEAADDLSREREQTDSNPKALLGLANDLARELAALLNCISSSSTYLSVIPNSEHV